MTRKSTNKNKTEQKTKSTGSNIVVSVNQEVSQLRMLGLPEDAIFDENYKKDVKSGIINVYSNEHVVIAELNFENDKLNGISKFYEKGDVVREISFVNGLKEGWAIEYGKEYRYVKGERKFQYSYHPSLPDYYEEREFQTHFLCRVCKFNSNHNYEGVGYIYDNGCVCKVVEYENGVEKRCFKEFDGSIMIELDDKGNKVYEGGYKNDQTMHFARNGNGKEYREGNVLIFEGTFENNKRKGEGTSFYGGKKEYSGTWNNNVPDGHGILYDLSGKEVYNGDWKEGRFIMSEYEWYDFEKKKVIKQNPCYQNLKKNYHYHKKAYIIVFILFVLFVLSFLSFLSFFLYQMYYTKIIYNSDNLHKFLTNTKLKSRIRWLVFSKNACNDFYDDLLLDNYPSLQVIRFQSNSVQNIQSLIIRNNIALRDIQISNMNCLTNVQHIILDGI